MIIKKKRRAVLIIVSLLIAFVIVALAYLMLESFKKFSSDEVLFRTAAENGITKFYYDGSGGGGENINTYIPVKFAEMVGTSKKNWVLYDDVSDNVKNAFVAVEDRSFFEHSGINIKRTLLAVINYIFNQSSDFGGSTITQQVVKNISGDSEKSVKRKAIELFRAINLELNHTKEEIFEVYLNIVPMGSGMIGVGVASEKYFGKQASELTVSEAATLVGITNSPEKYSPIKNPDECIKKRNSVLLCMKEMNFITDEEYEKGINAELNIRKSECLDSESNSWFVESVCDELCSDLMEKFGYSYNVARLVVSNGALSVYTTLDFEVQEKLEEYFENKNDFPKEIEEGLKFSMVIVDSRTASLKGIVGDVGKKRSARILNYATVCRAPGSTLKPLALYAPLIDSGEITWSTIFDDAPVTEYENSDGENVEFPKNSPAVYEGPITVSEALAKSKNTVAVRLYNILGADNIYNNLVRNYKFESIIEREVNTCGHVLTDKAASPLALGQLTRGIPLKTLVEAYTVFPNEGKLCDAKSYIAVYDFQGNELLRKNTSERRVISVESARIMNQLLSGVVDNGTASKITLNELVDTAGKTGTSGGNKDKLFVGYTPYYTAGIWCGYADYSKAVLNISKSHLQIWDEVMRSLHENITDSGMKHFSVDGIVRSHYCVKSGKLFTPDCFDDKQDSCMSYGYFIRGTEPSDFCDWHSDKTDFDEHGYVILQEVALCELKKRKKGNVI